MVNHANARHEQNHFVVHFDKFNVNKQISKIEAYLFSSKINLLFFFTLKNIITHKRKKHFYFLNKTLFCRSYGTWIKPIPYFCTMLFFINLFLVTSIQCFEIFKTCALLILTLSSVFELDRE